MTFLNLFAPIAFTIFLVGVSLRLGRVAKALVTRRQFRGVTPHFIGAPPRMKLHQALKAVLIDPLTRFHRKSNPTWGRGYALYHMAIVTEVISYSVSALIVAASLLMGRALPDVARHLEHGTNYSPANLLAIVFGNAEPLQAQFLFGNLAPIVVSITWVAVVLAVAGNLSLLITLLRRRSGAVVNDIDHASRGLRIAGRMPWDRLLVRGLIFCIIWTELLARLEVVPGIVYLHGALGLALFTLLPFTYLFHIVYAMIAVGYATRRRMARTLA